MNLPDTRANYEELFHFAGVLQHYLDAVMEETNRLDAAFAQLGDTWQDEKRMQFEDVYQQLHGALNAFHEQASEQVPHLNKLAQHLKDYHDT